MTFADSSLVKAFFPHPTNATNPIIKRTCFIRATLRLTGSGVNTGSLFLPRKKEGGVYAGDSRWGVVVPRGGVF
jgi:hypothetical protein